MKACWKLSMILAGLSLSIGLGVLATTSRAEASVDIDCGAAPYMATINLDRLAMDDSDDMANGGSSTEGYRSGCQLDCYNSASYCRAQCSTSYGNGASTECLRSCDSGLRACLDNCKK